MQQSDTQPVQLPTKGFVFIHGAGLGSWIWDDVVSHIDAPTLCIDFPERAGTIEARKALSFEDYIAPALTQITAWNVEKVVIVAHSIAGVVGVEIAGRLGDRVAGFIAVGAAIPRQGDSFLACLGFPQSMIMGTILRLAGTKPPASAIAKGLCSDLSDQQTKIVVEQFKAESRALYTGTATHTIPVGIPQMYIELSKDQEFGVAMQQRMASHLAQPAIVPLASGHLPMLSQPTALAGIIQQL